MLQLRRTDRTGHDGGAAALEFALVFPIVLLMLFGIIEFSFLFQNQLSMVQSAREGARIAAVNEWDESKVRASAYPLGSDPGLVVTLTVSEDEVKVVETYTYQTRILPNLGSIPLRASATMRREY